MKTKNRRRRKRQTVYWVYAKPNQMQGHKFTDDVALCKAQSKSEAIKKFKILYAVVEDKDVHKLATGKERYDYNNPDSRYRDLWILTDY